MLGKILTTEPPDITNDNFEEKLATDDLLVHYFNDFLSLPVFHEAVTYNKESGIFEVVTEAAESLTQQIRSALLEYRSKLLNDQAEPSYTPMIDNSYTVLCLDREQGIQWIERERLPLFLQSDCYFEYRLAKLLSQVDSSCLGRRLQVDSTYRPWAVTSEPQPAPLPVQDESETLPRIQTQSRDWLTLTSQNQTSLSTQSIMTTVRSLSVGSQDTLSPRTSDTISDFSSPQPASEDSVECNRKQESQSLHEAMEVYLTETRSAGPQHSTSAPQTLTASALEDFARSVVEQVLQNAISEMKAGSPCAQDEARSKSRAQGQGMVAQRAQLAGSHAEALIHGPPATDRAQKAEESEGLELLDETEEIDVDVGQSGIREAQKGLQDFKSFLQGTPGEKLFHLWMDIERLQSLQNKNSKHRFLIRMRTQYILSSGRCALSAEVLSRLGLASVPCWTEDKLHLAQIRITEVLLLYWWPRFHTGPNEEAVIASLRLWRDRQLRPPSGIDPNPRTVTLLPLRPASCGPRLAPSTSLQMLEPVPASVRHAGSKQASLRPHTHAAPSSCLKPLWESPYPVSTGAVPTTHWAPMNRAQSANKKSRLKDSPLSPFIDRRTPPLTKQLMSDGSCSPFLGGRRMERMLQALHTEMRSGLCFTHFCECSGNQLWANSIHFWTDLQDYHQTFYQDGLDPYRLQQQAQLLYSVYLSPGARMTVGVDEESRRQVQACLTPPFEELFDPAEEHVLTLLFEPWTMMTDRDRVAYEKVDLWEETRRIETAHYRKLQVMHRKLLCRLNQCVPERSPPPPSPEVPSEPDLWAEVPEQFRRYRLGSVLRHRLELQQFHSFLEENFASMDLMCWLDIEQYKRLPQKDRAQREERSKDIRSRYISRKYFFGPNSPASREQQEEVIRQGGGWGRILHGRLLGPMLAEVQDHARRRIEKKWLPLFLATPEFAERQKVKSQVDDVVEDQLFLRHRKKREVWKHVDGTWMASSKEVLAFRRALLNPVTCHQFQHFVSLKGDFLENGVLFWLEVQRYKNLFHSHCDEATIQHKVTLIVNAFINSSIPPALQILIPPEQARDILERRRDLGPYIFREAQMSVFTQLFKLWPQFLSFRTSVEERHILPMLEVRKEKQKEKLQRRRREEERRAQEEAEKQKSSLAVGLFEDGGSVFGGSQEEGVTARENGGPAYPTPQVSWSYSKYISALEQEQALLQSHAHLERGVGSLSLSSGTDSSRHSIKSEGSRRSRSQRSILSTRPQNIPH
ncbi:regulator of G-protein signaling 22 [Anguilla anguilla]|uniref:regulator of G-protein signaling 22 n=1 Tax=Anguilla anguilla TaxID=7936 RepID=UPI0015AC565C|nr:regulator of G-protein signaling 22 [Anguilla anguilla]